MWVGWTPILFSLAVQQLRVSECQVHQLPFSPEAGPRDAWTSRPERVRCKLRDFPPAQPAPSQGLGEHTLNPALERNSSAAPARSSAARARAGVAHLQPVTQARSARGWMEVGGTDQGRAGAAAGRSVAQRWEQRQTLARRHSAAGVCLAGPSAAASPR